MLIKGNVLEKVYNSDIIDGTVEIPEGVTEIDNWAFAECKSLTSIEIPENVTKIGDYAFNSCESLTSIEIPEGVTKIGEFAFCDCISLKSITIPSSVTEIGDGAFFRCKSLTSVEIPENVTKIGMGAFVGCRSLTSIEIPEGVTEIGDDAFFRCTSLTSIEIPEGVTEIGDDAFEGCESLTSVEIPEGVTKIGEVAFCDCISLKSITIPSSVTEIGHDAFNGCESLTSIEIPESVTKIGNSAFIGCRSLTSIEIPEGVTKIGDYAFNRCRSLTSVEIPEGVTEIGDSAFSGCTSLTSVTIPKSVTEMGENAFSENTYINFEEDVKESIVEDLYLKKGYKNMDTTKLFGMDIESFKKFRNEISYIGKISEDFNDEQFDVFLGRMIKTIGFDEAKRAFEIPNLTKEEIKQYALEKDEMFQSLYETKYKLSGDFGGAIEILKALSFNKTKGDPNEKNTYEQQIFKNINRLLENNEIKITSIGELIERISEENNELKLTEEDIKRIKEIEKKINGRFIRRGLEETKEKLKEYLQRGNEIVPAQIEPIAKMIEDVIEGEFREKGKLDEKRLNELISEKIGNANAPYIRQNKDLIVNMAMEYVEDKEVKELLNHSVYDALVKTKESIGTGWVNKIKTALGEMSYSFGNLPNVFTEKDIKQLEERLKIGIDTESIAVIKDKEKREEAFKLLEGKNIPKIMTYKQLHDMFGSVHEPYSEKFKEFFKKNRERFLTDLECITYFGKIQNKFEDIINSKELRMIYEKGELTIDHILGYLETREYGNQREGDKELARYAKTLKTAANDEEFKYHQEIFDVVRKREASSIPPIYVKQGKYRGRMLSPDDVLNIFAGNITTCCQKFGDVGEGAVLLRKLRR